jgi:hypothetical protein
MMPASWLPRVALLVMLVLLGSSAPAMGQAQAVASRPSHAAQLKNALRSVAAAQARHHVAKRTFAATAEALRLPPAPGVRVEILAASHSGWQARAQHKEQPGRSCVIFVGRLEGNEAPRTDGDREMAGEEGVPLCDRMR